MSKISFCFLCLPKKRKRQQISKDKAKPSNAEPKDLKTNHSQAAKNTPNGSTIRKKTGVKSMSKSMMNIRFKKEIDTNTQLTATVSRKVSLTETSTDLGSAGKPGPQEHFNTEKTHESFNENASIRARLSSREAASEEVEQDVFLYEKGLDEGSFVFSGCKVMDSEHVLTSNESCDVFYESNRIEMNSLCRGRKYE